MFFLHNRMRIIKEFLFFVKNCWSRLWNRQFLTFLFFLLLSSVFWFLQSGYETIEREFTIPVRLTGVPDNVVLTTDPPASVRVTLRDRGLTLMSYRYFRQLGPIVIKWDEINTSGGHVSLSTVELLKPILSARASGTKLVSVRPETIDFYYNYGQSKALPVVFQGKITPDSAYSLVSLDVEPRTVRVYASRNVLDTLTAAYLEPVHLANLIDTTTVKRRFVKVPGVKFVPSSARITIVTDRMIEKTVQVPVQGVNFPAAKTLRTFPPKVNITFQVGMSQYKSVTPESFVLVVNYADLLQNNDNRCRLSLKSLPLGVRRARINPSEVEYVVEDTSPDELE